MNPIQVTQILRPLVVDADPRGLQPPEAGQCARSVRRPTATRSADADSPILWRMTLPGPGDPYTVQLWRTMHGSTWTRLPAVGIPSTGFKGQLWFADDSHELLLVTDPNASVRGLLSRYAWGSGVRLRPRKCLAS